MNNDSRILELALHGLEAERHRIEEEMTAIQEQLGLTRSRRTPGSFNSIRSTQKRQMSEAGRKAISDAMKRRWAKFRKTAVKK